MKGTCFRLMAAVAVLLMLCTACQTGDGAESFFPFSTSSAQETTSSESSSSGGGGEENVPVSVTITSPANAALEPGEYELTAAVEPASAPQTVSFSLEGTYASRASTRSATSPSGTRTPSSWKTKFSTTIFPKG